jgi:hypothetical protein
MVAHDDGSACAAWNAPVMMYDPSLEVCLLRWPKDYIDRSLAGDPIAAPTLARSRAVTLVGTHRPCVASSRLSAL